MESGHAPGARDRTSRVTSLTWTPSLAAWFHCVLVLGGLRLARTSPWPWAFGSYVKLRAAPPG